LFAEIGSDLTTIRMKENLNMKTLYDFPTTVGLVGPIRCGKTDEETRRKSYFAVRHAVKYKRVVEPEQYGKALLFTEEQIEALRRHFGVEEGDK
jgi:hypothetical protein